MSKRIKQLAEQAGIEFTYDPTEVPMRAFIEAWEGDLEKFAELIVRECIECADIVGKANLSLGYPNSTSHHIKQKIKEHFGVEE